MRTRILILSTILTIVWIIAASSPLPSSAGSTSELMVAVEIRCIELTGEVAWAARSPNAQVPDNWPKESFKLVITEGRPGTLRIGEEQELRSRIEREDGMARAVPTTYLDGTEIQVGARVSEDRKYAHLDIEFLRQKILGVRRYRESILLTESPGSPWSLEVEVPRLEKVSTTTSVTVPDGGTALILREESGTEPETARTMHVLVTAQIVALRDEEKNLFQQRSRKK